MKDRRQKPRRAGTGLRPLPPEAALELKGQVARLTEALSTGAGPEALRDLATTRPEDAAWDLHLMQELEKARHAAVPALLAALFGKSPDKERQKALKRALHVLKTRGVPVADDLLPRKEPQGPIPQETPLFQGHLSPVFGHGESYVVLEAPRAILGGNFLVARVSDTYGFREFHLLNLNRRHREELWEQLRSEGVGRIAPAPPAYALRLLEEALALTPGGEPSRDDYLPLREALWRHLGRPEEAPTSDRLLPPPDPADRHAALGRSRDLVKTGFFGSWIPAFERIQPWLEKLKAAQESPLILTEQQQQQRRQSVQDDAIIALFPPETRSLWGRRLQKMSCFFYFLDRPEEARAAQAAGADLLSGEVSALTGENPFLQELVRQAVLLASELLRRQEGQSESSGLVAPSTTPLIWR